MIALLLASCGWPTAQPSHDAGFPHPADYEDVGHGPDALQPDADCGACHASDGPGETCAECHAGYPHEPAFVDGAVHGAALDDSCTPCHGAAGDRAPADVTPGTCTHCHSTFPHPADWEDEALHGAATLDRGSSVACEACHPVGAPDGCAECHAYPHPADMLQSHGPAWTPALDCGTCHEPGRAAPSCDGCHIDVPHPEGWSMPGHLAAVQARGEGTCTGCHPPGSLVGPALPQSCSDTCHGEGP